MYVNACASHPEQPVSAAPPHCRCCAVGRSEEPGSDRRCSICTAAPGWFLKIHTNTKMILFNFVINYEDEIFSYVSLTLTYITDAETKIYCDWFEVTYTYNHRWRRYCGSHTKLNINPWMTEPAADSCAHPGYQWLIHFYINISGSLSRSLNALRHHLHPKF